MELSALHDLYYDTQGIHWLWRNDSTGTHWNFTDGSNPCTDQWQGISCVLPPPFDTYYVSNISLQGYNLAGNLSDSIGHLAFLRSLILTKNYLTGTIPANVAMLSSLEELDLSRNFLERFVPAGLCELSALRILDLHFNYLTGTVPRELSQLTQLQMISLSYNKLSGTLENRFNATAQIDLHNVILNDNAFTGTLPEEILSNVHLKALYLDNNCFTGTLSDSLCNSHDMQVISLGGLHSATACRVHIMPQISSSFVVRNAVHGTVPACLLQLPVLRALILTNNRLAGFIPYNAPIGANLTQLVLSNNQLTGSIPETVQHGGIYNLDLTYNQFSGNLISQGVTLQYKQEVGLEYNLLTGSIPSVYREPLSISILRGNMFSCLLDKSDLPKNDGGIQNYQCGSDDYNSPYVMWLVLVGLWCVIAYIVYRAREHVYFAYAKEIIVHAKLWIIRVRELELASVRDVREEGKHLTTLGCYCALVLVVVGAPVYAVLTAYFGTYNMQYAWTASIVLLAGVWPYVCGTVLWACALGMFAVICSQRNKRAGKNNDIKHILSLRKIEVASVCSMYIIINVVLAITANIYFVWTVLYQPASLQIALSIYKVIWNSACLPYLSRWMVHKLSAHRADFFSLELLVALLCNVIIPIMCVVVVTPTCFYGAIVPNSITSVQTVVDQEWIYNVNYSVPFTYKYQCSFTYLKYYASAYIYLGIFSTFGIPVYEMTALYLYNRAAPGTYWYYWVNRATPRILKPLATDPEKILARNIFRPYFDATKFLIGQLTCLALILSIGVVSPPVAACLAVNMVATAAYTVLKVGRFLSNAAESNQLKYLELIEEESRDVVTTSMLRRAFWLILTFSCAFITPFLFDVLGATEGLQHSFWVLVVYPTLPVVLYVAVRLPRCVIPSGNRSVEGDKAGSKEVEVELQTTVVLSPMVAAGGELA